MRKCVLFLCLLFGSCIGDDIIMDRVSTQVRLVNPIDTLGLGESYQFELLYFNNIGSEEIPPVLNWTSSAPAVVAIDDQGLATALAEGQSTLTAEVISDEGETATAHLDLIVGTNTVTTGSSRSGSLRTTSSYLLTGDFALDETPDGVILSFADNYSASTALPGLYIYLTNNPNTIDNALEIGRVEIFKGEHQYELKNVGLSDFSHVLYFCKPFRVKVGDGAFEN